MSPTPVAAGANAKARSPPCCVVAEAPPSWGLSNSGGLRRQAGRRGSQAGKASHPASAQPVAAKLCCCRCVKHSLLQGCGNGCGHVCCVQRSLLYSCGQGCGHGCCVQRSLLYSCGQGCGHGCCVQPSLHYNLRLLCNCCWVECSLNGQTEKGVRRRRRAEAPLSCKAELNSTNPCLACICPLAIPNQAPSQHPSPLQHTAQRTSLSLHDT